MNKTEKNLTDLTHRQQLLIDVIVFLLIVTVGIASRFWLSDVPNFKPVAALVLFGGFFFRKAWPAMAALFLIMLVSDLKLGAYNWQLAACVYASLGIACGLGVWIKRSVDVRGARKLGWKQVGRFAAPRWSCRQYFTSYPTGRSGGWRRATPRPGPGWPIATLLEFRFSARRCWAICALPDYWLAVTHCSKQFCCDR